MAATAGMSKMCLDFRSSSVDSSAPSSIANSVSGFTDSTVSLIHEPDDTLAIVSTASYPD